MNTTNTITTTELVDKYGEKISNAIEQLAAQIGVGVDHFWPLFVKQQMIDGWINLLTPIILILVSSVYLVLTRNKWEDKTKDDISWQGVGGIIIGFVLAISIVFSFVHGTTAVKQIINPEYYAIKEITEMIRN